MGSLQNITVAGLVADLGLTGHKGIAAARNSGDHTTLDVAITQPAWVLLGGGTMFTTDLVDTTVQAPTTDGDYVLYIDAVAHVTAVVPTWTIAAAAPGVNAIAIADVVVADGVISAATVRDEGLRSLPVQPAALPSPAGVPALRGPFAVDYTDIAHDGDTVTLWTPQVGDIVLFVVADAAAALPFDNPASFTNGILSMGQDLAGAGTPWAVNVANLAFGGYLSPGSWPSNLNSVYHIQSTDPIQVRYVDGGDGDLTAGHTELYAVIARAVAP